LNPQTAEIEDDEGPWSAIWSASEYYRPDHFGQASRLEIGDTQNTILRYLLRLDGLQVENLRHSRQECLRHDRETSR